MTFDPAQRRAALERFIEDNPRLKVYPWTMTAGMGEATLRSFLRSRSRTLTDESYERLAEAATVLLGRPVRAAELRGEWSPARVRAAFELTAAGELAPVGELDDVPVVDLPPGADPLRSVVVRGELARPAYESGDVLFYGTPETPQRLLGRSVVARIKGGPMMVARIVRGSRRNRFHLFVMTAAGTMAEDKPVEWAAPVEWLRRRTI